MIAYRLDFKDGDIVDGKYRIIKEPIGSGGYGTVFRVEDMSHREFALKLLRLWEVLNELHEQLVGRFEREYMTSRISSDYLIHSLDFGVVGGNPYLVSEYCPDGDLSKLIGKPIKNLPRIARDILEGLHILHSEGKVHRDLKPENVLIRPNGKAALTDFGVVGEMNEDKRTTEMGGWLKKRLKQQHGSPLYMSPEMVDREGGITYLPTVDIWSFGVMMYELVTGGHFPFGDISTPDELPGYYKRAKRNEWDRKRLRSCPDGSNWYDIISRCLEPDYRKRYQSAAEIMQDLKPMLGNASREFRPTGPRSSAIRRIVITQGGGIGAGYSLMGIMTQTGRRMIRVGRELNNDISLEEQGSIYLSRYHFTLECSSDGTYWLIRDGQWKIDERRWVTSTNGTYLNATLVDEKGIKIFTGDIITAGEFKIKVE